MCAYRFLKLVKSLVRFVCGADGFLTHFFSRTERKNRSFFWSSKFIWRKYILQFRSPGLHYTLALWLTTRNRIPNVHGSTSEINKIFFQLFNFSVNILIRRTFGIQGDTEVKQLRKKKLLGKKSRDSGRKCWCEGH